MILFAIFAVLTIAAATADITDAEARLLWIVRDPERIEPAAIGDTARLIGRNFRAMLDRAETRDLPLAVPLDVWTMIAGGSIFAARLPAVLFACLIIAAAIRLIWRYFHGRIAVITFLTFMLLCCGLCINIYIFHYFFLTSTDAVVQAYRAERAVEEPVITAFMDDSPLGYYQAQYDLRRGIGVDLGWRDFSDDEIERAAANLGSQPVWLIVEDYRGYSSINQALQTAGYRAVSCQGRYQRAAVIRYDRVEADTDVAPATCPES